MIDQAFIDELRSMPDEAQAHANSIADACLDVLAGYPDGQDNVSRCVTSARRGRCTVARVTVPPPARYERGSITIQVARHGKMFSKNIEAEDRVGLDRNEIDLALGALDRAGVQETLFASVTSVGEGASPAV